MPPRHREEGQQRFDDDEIEMEEALLVRQPLRSSFGVHIYDRYWEEDYWSTTTGEIDVPDILSVIFLFVHADIRTLLSVGLVCRAWHERSERLPQWFMLDRGTLATRALQSALGVLGFGANRLADIRVSRADFIEDRRAHIEIQQMQAYQRRLLEVKVVVLRVLFSVFLGIAAAVSLLVCYALGTAINAQGAVLFILLTTIILPLWSVIALPVSKCLWSRMKTACLPSVVQVDDKLRLLGIQVGFLIVSFLLGILLGLGTSRLDVARTIADTQVFVPSCNTFDGEPYWVAFPPGTLREQNWTFRNSTPRLDYFGYRPYAYLLCPSNKTLCGRLQDLPCVAFIAADEDENVSSLEWAERYVAANDDKTLYFRTPLDDVSIPSDALSSAQAQDSASRCWKDNESNNLFPLVGLVYETTSPEELVEWYESLQRVVVEIAIIMWCAITITVLLPGRLSTASSIFWVILAVLLLNPITMIVFGALCTADQTHSYCLTDEDVSFLLIALGSATFILVLRSCIRPGFANIGRRCGIA